MSNPAIEQKPRKAPRETPDSLPKRDEGSDVVPDKVRDGDPAFAPDSPPPDDDAPPDNDRPEQANS
jgi:hypothetical protein